MEHEMFGISEIVGKKIPANPFLSVSEREQLMYFL